MDESHLKPFHLGNYLKKHSTGGLQSSPKTLQTFNIHLQHLIFVKFNYKYVHSSQQLNNDCWERNVELDAALMCFTRTAQSINITQKNSLCRFFTFFKKILTLILKSKWYITKNIKLLFHSNSELHFLLKIYS